MPSLRSGCILVGWRREGVVGGTSTANTAKLARPSASACSATADISGAGAQPKVPSDHITQKN
jgi:hypothetical protein